MAPSFPPSPPHPPALGRRDSDEDDQDMYDREMSLGNAALLNGHSRKEKNNHPLKSLTPRRIAAIAATLLFLIFWFGKGTGTVTETGVARVPSPPVVEEEHFPLGGSKQGEKAPDAAEVPVEKLPADSPQKQASPQNAPVKPGAAPAKGKCTPPKGQKEL